MTTTVRRILPDLQTEDVVAAKQFYTSVLGLEVVMDLQWVAMLASPDSPTAQLNLMVDDASSAVSPAISAEVDDVDSVFDAATAAGSEIVYPLTDEPWGVRRFFVRDPDGRVVNVLSHS
ncbi:VOC family protein [Antrihabitans cavernicola]|uniref:Glyoxalase n=1 Tax=Antrihabitans cavernicola TaxID=2495913 RepID=A0A5A7SD77_9NOCA|nr:VOC family protein [Spelaeibacter cavernicola]KAA0022445.1 glyoxalase [Spelaeibacter cavernicola]